MSNSITATHSIIEDYQPGNGTRYFIQLTKIRYYVTLVWFDNADIGGKAFRFSPHVTPSDMLENENSTQYFMGKMGLKNIGDAKALLERVVRFESEVS